MIPDFFFPQAAIGGDLKSAEPYWDDDKYVAQRKLDGARYILHKDMNGMVRAYSRQISKKTGVPVLKTEQLIHLVKEFMSLVPPGTVIDGEVCAPGLSNSNLVTRVTGSKPERAKEIQQKDGYLVYHAFDCLAYDGKVLTELPMLDRYNKLAGHGVEGKFIQVEPIYFTDKRKLYDDFTAEGGEGIMLKDIQASYHQGERHKSFVKVKRQKTYDVVFMTIELAHDTSVKKGDSAATTTRIAGKAGAIVYGQYIVKKAYNFGPTKHDSGESLFATVAMVPEQRDLLKLGTVGGFDDATRDDITENYEKYRGRVFEVRAQEQFSSGALRFPRFVRWRDDKNAEDCVFRKDEG